MSNDLSPPLILSTEVTSAKRSGRPVVALESTIITHGMPWPQNLDMAREVEDIVRQGGAIPATIALMSGKIHIGLNPAELKVLAQAKDVRKVSRADLAACLVMETLGATTVAATMICAHLAGISVFATGGIGGVHRRAETTFDVSADLQELAQTPVTVVAAGAKAILDIPKTLEVLETLGVPVIGWQVNQFPAFWSRQSGLSVSLRAQSAIDIAKAHHMRAALGLPGGQLVANPVPKEAELPARYLEPLIKLAITESVAQRIDGKEVTPFLLNRIYELTEGRSLVTNIALVKNNAQLATKIALAM